MGEVYEALDTTLSERVALKTIGVESPLDSQGIARMKAEVQLARRVTHPNVCRVFDVGFHRTQTLTAGGEPLIIPFLTMELLDGETLRARIASKGALAPEAALAIVAQMAAGLDAAHAAGIVHADLKADNVIVCAPADSPRVVITDFGLARRYRAGSISSSSAGMAGGTVGYMAPEHLDGRRPGPVGDIYSLGVVLFEMLTGKLPFPAKSPLAAAVASVTGAPPSLRDRAGVPAWWDTVIRRCLDPSPERRFQQGAELVAALRSPGRARSRRRNWLVLSAGLLLTIAAALVAVRVLDRRSTVAPVVAEPVVPPRPPAVAPPPPSPALSTGPTSDPAPAERPAPPRVVRRRSVAPPPAPSRPTLPLTPQPASVREEPGDDDAIDPF
jgi:serine/threonine protein kinase